MSTKESEKEQQREQRREELAQILGMRLLTVDAVADKLRMHRQSVIKDIRTGKLPAYRIERFYLIREADLWGYLQRTKILSSEVVTQESEPLVPPQPPTKFQDLVFLSMEDVMLFLHRNRPSLLKDVAENKLTVYQPGKNMLIAREEVLKYLESFRVVPDLKEEEA